MIKFYFIRLITNLECQTQVRQWTLHHRILLELEFLNNELQEVNDIWLFVKCYIFNISIIFNYLIINWLKFICKSQIYNIVPWSWPNISWILS
jgi:hypothetical protein